MDAVAGRVQNNGVRTFCNRIQYFQDVSCNELTVRKTVLRRVDLRRFHGFLYDLHTDHLLCDRRQDLSDRAGTAIKIVHQLSVHTADILSGQGVQNLCSQRICLKERKWSNLKTQSEKFFIKMVPTVEHNCLLTLYGIRRKIVDRL